MFERIGIHTSIAAADQFNGEFGGQPINGLVITGANATASIAIRVRNKNGTVQLVNNITMGALGQIDQIRSNSALISATNTTLFIDLGFIDLTSGTLDYVLTNGTVAVSAYTVSVVRIKHGIEHYKVYEATQDLNNNIDNAVRLYLINPTTALDTITVRNMNYSNLFTAPGTVSYAQCLQNSSQSTTSAGVCFDSEDGIPEKISYSLTRTGASTAYTIAEKIYIIGHGLTERFKNETRGKMNQLPPATQANLIQAAKTNNLNKIQV